MVNIRRPATPNDVLARARREGLLLDDRVDTQAGIEQVAEYGRRMRSARRRRLVDLVVEHMHAELIDYDLERTMATMVDEPAHIFYGTNRIANVIGARAVREYYERSFTFGPNRAATDHYRVVVGDDCVAMDGVVLYSAQSMVQRMPSLADAIAQVGRAVFVKHLCVVLPIEDGRIAAELHYFDNDFSAADLVRLSDDGSTDDGH